MVVAPCVSLFRSLILTQFKSRYFHNAHNRAISLSDGRFGPDWFPGIPDACTSAVAVAVAVTD